ncbi:GNAT family N-acetyltransferase [Allokutzneria sp. A3M-2-11 16]|uniref:GNAT family N-acetyltransferase n=1 Tax=Allokutzneria sp. A3M-2-11 16 TaxID=2962043 RepID=UPI0020B68D42|nr:GNAT family protein [Allokutzneria sp. A3M-2-11 16]MCP3803550.1 GNAT family N-acetyltransferase [Allokutzneria sp. A3M-2-11 16]
MSLRITGDRATLRDWAPEDEAVLPDLLAPHRPWHDTNGPYLGRPTEEQLAAKVRRIAERARSLPEDLPEPRTSLAVLDTGSNRLIGEVSWYWEAEPASWRRMGVVIFDEVYWGGGYGTDALRLWTGYLFETTDALRLDFATYSGNPGMAAVGRKLGFTEEARFRNGRVLDGVAYDGLVFGVLREEWLARRDGLG